jgi:iron complex outermembrane receptor protein/hemoglobin/transferrin/lactoferrin receptor protein
LERRSQVFRAATHFRGDRLPAGFTSSFALTQDALALRVAAKQQASVRARLLRLARNRGRWALAGAVLCQSLPAWSAPPPAAKTGANPAGEAPGVEEPSPASDAKTIEVEVVGSSEDPTALDRAASVVTREEIEAQQPRSAPDAIRYEPGVFIQQSSHAQASPYIRGLTGQQTLLIFDGIRLNNSTFRQGPNQYFFSVDTRSVERIEVIRGAASTLYGADAMGGAILSTPIAPRLELGEGFKVRPSASTTARSADQEIGGRGQLEFTYGGKWGVVGGYGYRDVGQLESGGFVRSPATGEVHKSPRLLADGRTQMGTGFREGAGDVRIVYAPTSRFSATLALYDYRQYDAPRTDKCPPPEAREDECLVYLQQYRLLSYLALDWQGKSPVLAKARWTLSYQRQREWRQWFRDNLLDDVPGGTASNDRDIVHSLGTAFSGESSPVVWNSQASTSVHYGADFYADDVRSETWQVFTDLDPSVRIDLPRGQYVNGSRYLTSGAFADLRHDLFHRWQVSTGARVGLMAAKVPEQAESGTMGLNKSWAAFAGRFGSALRIGDSWQWLLNIDQGFRAPNLDDLTSRQQIGPGYQLENPRLHPEKSTSFETGLRLRHANLEASVFGFYSRLRELMVRVPRNVDACPPGEQGPGACAGSRSRFQLTNLAGSARLMGAEAMLMATWPSWIRARTHVSYAFGDSQNPLPRPTEPTSSQPYQRRVPLSRTPPLNGSLILDWIHWHRYVLSAGLRWANEQSRLSLADTFDVRIPTGGTPAFAVVDFRISVAPHPALTLYLNMENLLDTPYRQHGSSINGAGRSLSATMRLRY